MNEQRTIPGFENTNSELGKQAVICHKEEKKLNSQQNKCDSENSELMVLLKKEGKKSVKIKTADDKTVTLNYKRTHTRTKEKIVIKEVEDV